MITILIVDDKVDNLYLLQSLLGSNGFRVISARNGAEALGLIRNGAPDLIITDILMPVMDGFTLCRECKKDKNLKKIPFFFYTATYTNSKDEEYALSLGADRFILKPQEPEIFLKLIVDFLEEVRKKKIHPREIVQRPETVVLREYNEVLVRKLEDKILQTEKTERDLRKYSEELEKEIAERKKSEDSLRESRELFQTLAQASPVGIFRTTPDGSTIYVNPKWSELSGLSLEEALGNGWLVAVHPEDREKVSGTWLDDSKSRIVSNAEYRFIKPDGSIVWVIGMAVPEFIENEVIGYIGTITDITDRKLAEIALTESETKYRQLVTKSPDGIFIVDLSGRFQSVNSTICDNLKYTEAELLSMNLLDLVPEKYHSLHKERLLLIIDGKSTTADAEYVVLGKDGKAHFIEVLSVPYYKGEEIIGFQGIARDTTERRRMDDLLRESEEKYRRIFENVQDLYYETSMDGTILEVSPSILFLSKDQYHQNDLIGKSIYDFYLDPDERAALLAQLKERGSVSDFEITLKNKDDSIVPCSLSSKICFDEKGNPCKIIGSMRDITERKNNTEKLKLAKEKAEESDRLKTAFLHNISHEIRTPMNAIVGFSALLTDPGLDEASKLSFIDTITQSSNQLLAIINDIIEISNIEAGILKFSKDEIKINSVFQRLYDQFNPLAIEKNIVFRKETLLPDNEALIQSDKSKFIHILTNLLSNAFKFTTNGRIEFGYVLSGKTIDFYVSDTGIGLSEEQYQRVFDRFYQVEHIMARHFEGLGLGLSISKAFVELMGGKIWVDSKLGKGSVFHFSLPFDKPQAVPATSSTFQGINFNRQPSILVAEDDENNYNLIVKFLADLNPKFTRANNGLEAVKFCESTEIVDLVLMDLKMPEIDGYEATSRIKKLRPDLPVIVQTAFSEEKWKHPDSSFTDIIIKPFSKRDLLEIVKKYIIV